MKAGETVKAYHPRMFGVVKEGRVVHVGPKLVKIDFGSLLGGVYAVPVKDVVWR